MHTTRIHVNISKQFVRLFAETLQTALQKW